MKVLKSQKSVGGFTKEKVAMKFNRYRIIFSVFTLLIIVSNYQAIWAQSGIITFNEQRYEEILYDKLYNGSENNTIIDTEMGVEFIIAYGQMYVDKLVPPDENLLFFTPFLPNGTNDPCGRVVIRFTNSKERVRVRVAHDEHPIKDPYYFTVKFYKDYEPSNPLQMEDITDDYSNFVDIEYTNTSDGIKMVILNSHFSENGIDEIEFDELVVPPVAPTNLTVAILYPFQIDLTWEVNSDDEDGFRIERLQGPIGTWTEIGRTTTGAESFVDNKFKSNTTYTYRVCAFKGDVDSDFSNTASTTTSPPIAPTNLTATAVSQSQIDLTWDDNSNNEIGFKIERLREPIGFWTQVGTTPAGAESFSDTGLESNTTYSYRVYAYNGRGNSDYSNQASAKTIGFLLPKTTDQDLWEEQAIIPTEFSLMQNSPNPFNPETQISFSLPQAEEVELKIFNLQGQLIQTLVNNSMQSGYHTVHWNGKDSNGRKVADGIYFYVLQAGQFKAVKRMTLLK